MGQGGDPLALDDLGDLGGVGGGAPAGAVGDAHKVGFELGDLLHGDGHGGEVAVLFGREGFEREGDFLFLPEVAEFHGVGSFSAGIRSASCLARRAAATRMLNTNQNSIMARG